MELSKRLAAIAALSEGGVNIADVGTDHGYIPVWLREKGRAGRIAASDIGEGPLMSARRTAEEHGAADIEFILADGLCGLDDDFDTFIIAGMGGDTIIHILENAPFSLAGKLLVLQPQTRTDKLLSWLYENGFIVEKAALVKDGGKLYTVFRAVSGSGRRELTGSETFGLGLLAGDPLFPEYKERLIEKLSASISGIEASREPDVERLFELKKLLNEVRECF